MNYPYIILMIFLSKAVNDKIRKDDFLNEMLDNVYSSTEKPNNNNQKSEKQDQILTHENNNYEITNSINDKNSQNKKSLQPSTNNIEFNTKLDILPNESEHHNLINLESNNDSSTDESNPHYQTQGKKTSTEQNSDFENKNYKFTEQNEEKPDQLDSIDNDIPNSGILNSKRNKQKLLTEEASSSNSDPVAEQAKILSEQNDKQDEEKESSKDSIENYSYPYSFTIQYNWHLKVDGEPLATMNNRVRDVTMKQFSHYSLFPIDRLTLPDRNVDREIESSYMIFRQNKQKNSKLIWKDAEKILCINSCCIMEDQITQFNGGEKYSLNHSKPTKEVQHNGRKVTKRTGCIHLYKDKTKMPSRIIYNFSILKQWQQIKKDFKIQQDNKSMYVKKRGIANIIKQEISQNYVTTDLITLDQNLNFYPFKYTKNIDMYKIQTKYVEQNKNMLSKFITPLNTNEENFKKIYSLFSNLILVNQYATNIQSLRFENYINIVLGRLSEPDHQFDQDDQGIRYLKSNQIEKCNQTVIKNEKVVKFVKDAQILLKIPLLIQWKHIRKVCLNEKKLEKYGGFNIQNGQPSFKNSDFDQLSLISYNLVDKFIYLSNITGELDDFSQILSKFITIHKMKSSSEKKIKNKVSALKYNSKNFFNKFEQIGEKQEVCKFMFNEFAKTTKVNNIKIKNNKEVKQFENENDIIKTLKYLDFDERVLSQLISDKEDEENLYTYEEDQTRFKQKDQAKYRKHNNDNQKEQNEVKDSNNDCETDHIDNNYDIFEKRDQDGDKSKNQQYAQYLASPILKDNQFNCNVGNSDSQRLIFAESSMFETLCKEIKEKKINNVDSEEQKEIYHKILNQYNSNYFKKLAQYNNNQQIQDLIDLKNFLQSARDDNTSTSFANSVNATINTFLTKTFPAAASRGFKGQKFSMKTIYNMFYNVQRHILTSGIFRLLDKYEDCLFESSGGTPQNIKIKKVPKEQHHEYQAVQNNDTYSVYSLNMDKMLRQPQSKESFKQQKKEDPNNLYNWPSPAESLCLIPPNQTSAHSMIKSQCDEDQMISQFEYYNFLLSKAEINLESKSINKADYADTPLRCYCFNQAKRLREMQNIASNIWLVDMIFGSKNLYCKLQLYELILDNMMFTKSTQKQITENEVKQKTQRYLQEVCDRFDMLDVQGKVLTSASQMSHTNYNSSYQQKHTKSDFIQWQIMNADNLKQESIFTKDQQKSINDWIKKLNLSQTTYNINLSIIGPAEQQVQWKLLLVKQDLDKVMLQSPKYFSLKDFVFEQKKNQTMIKECRKNAKVAHMMNIRKYFQDLQTIFQKCNSQIQLKHLVFDSENLKIGNLIEMQKCVHQCDVKIPISSSRSHLIPDEKVEEMKIMKHQKCWMDECMNFKDKNWEPYLKGSKNTVKQKDINNNKCKKTNTLIEYLKTLWKVHPRDQKTYQPNIEKKVQIPEAKKSVGVFRSLIGSGQIKVHNDDRQCYIHDNNRKQCCYKQTDNHRCFSCVNIEKEHIREMCYILMYSFPYMSNKQFLGYEDFKYYQVMFLKSNIDKFKNYTDELENTEQLHKNNQLIYSKRKSQLIQPRQQFVMLYSKSITKSIQNQREIQKFRPRAITNNGLCKNSKQQIETCDTNFQENNLREKQDEIDREEVMMHQRSDQYNQILQDYIHDEPTFRISISKMSIHTLEDILCVGERFQTVFRKYDFIENGCYESTPEDDLQMYGKSLKLYCLIIIDNIRTCSNYFKSDLKLCVQKRFFGKIYGLNQTWSKVFQEFTNNMASRKLLQGLSKFHTMTVVQRRTVKNCGFEKELF